MAQTKKQQVIGLLSQIKDPQELVEIKAHADLWLKQVSSTNQGIDIFWNSLVDVARQHFRINLPPSPRNLSDASYKVYEANKFEVLAFYDEHFNVSSQAEKIKLYKIGFELCITAFLVWSELPTHSQIVKQLETIPSLFELNFPGYIEGGLSQVILSGRIK